MTQHSSNHSNITLPLLIDYVDTLLPSLTTQVGATSSQPNDNAEVLWVLQDKDAQLGIGPQLNSHVANQSHSSSTADMQKLQISTLSKLFHQPLLERYTLACFWLPTLSSELLQQYIPLLMRYRDLYAAHVLIALDDTVDLKAYGFTPFDVLNEQPSEDKVINKAISSSDSATLWQFNLYDYKQLPNWLNADYWANPENWGKNRW
ncbi:DUF6231 family protein [Psychrobacter alimentarius]|uniref:DUF6231 family protein n=1 Tax=Psychrobacter alimentarius TaxID=261164 RepID=UPI003FD24CFA